MKLGKERRSMCFVEYTGLKRVHRCRMKNRAVEDTCSTSIMTLENRLRPRVLFERR